MQVRCPECRSIAEIDDQDSPRFKCEECETELRLPGTPPRKRKSQKSAPPVSGKSLLIGLGLIVICTVLGLWAFAKPVGVAVVDKKQDDAIQDMIRQNKANADALAQNPKPVVPIQKNDGDQERIQTESREKSEKIPDEFKDRMDASKRYSEFLRSSINCTVFEAKAPFYKPMNEQDHFLEIDNLECQGKNPFGSDFFTFDIKITDNTVLKKLKKYNSAHLIVEHKGVLYERFIHVFNLETGNKRVMITGSDFKLTKVPSEFTIWLEDESGFGKEVGNNQITKPLVFKYEPSK
jgi:hypothetical protein